MGKMAIKLQIYYQKIFVLKGEGVPRNSIALNRRRKQCFKYNTNN
jgi:hypothetical protein